MRKTALSVALLLILALVTGGCWPWERTPRPPQTPPPTETPPQVEEANRSSPAIEGRLLYARNGHIWLRTGTTATRLTELAEGLQATQPCWSPTGTQIAFIVKGDNYSDLWVMDADGSNPHPLTESRSGQPGHTYESAHSSFWVFQPSWSPGGEWIYYISHSLPQSSFSMMSIWRIPASGGSEEQYLPLGSNIEKPSWSPDGSLLAFTLFVYESGPQLRYWDPEIGATRPLGEDVEGVERYDPAWSPDSNWVAYTARQQGQHDIWLMPSPQNPLYETGWSPLRLTTQGLARGPAWSPDGRQIVFVAEAGESFDLWLLHLESNPGQIPKLAKLEQLTEGHSVDATANPCWTR